jgi:hypothetical protein
MKQLQSWASSFVGKLQSLAALFDPETLQWPGGTVIALVLMCCAALSLALGVGRRSSRSPYALG